MKKKFSLLYLLMILLLAFTSIGWNFMDEICGSSSKDPADFFSKASPRALKLVERAWQDYPNQTVYDLHVHAFGNNEKENGNYINPESIKIAHVTHYLRLKAYLSAGKVNNINSIDEQYITHLVRLARNMGHPVRLYLLALDKYYDKSGNVVMKNTDCYVSNQYVFKIANTYPDIFEPVVSIHPYRRDAVEELEQWAKKGVRMVKWIPNVQGMDPSDESIVPFYLTMKKFNMTLLVHSGEELALETHGQQYLGNPLLLRRPLDCGVRVIVAHCASSGKNVDLDDPRKRKVHNFDLFMRLMAEKKYEGLLYADISGTTQFNRMNKTLPVLLNRQYIHARLVNGSDYPLPAINVLIHTANFVKKGYITKDEQKALKEIYDYNPLLFDFVLKRTIRKPGSDHGFSPKLFINNPLSTNRISETG
ncbi:MAG TPA: amidohydrolase family protein [Smithella sp.]|nr:amidohydrolase family protein [Smithella sp.]